MNLGHSPAATSSSSTESPAPNTYNIGSVSSNYTGSDPDSDSDNCNPQKMGVSSAEVPSSGVQDNEVIFIFEKKNIWKYLSKNSKKNLIYTNIA